MSIILILLCLLATITIAAYIYVRAMRGISHKETVHSLWRGVQSGANSVISLYSRCKAREHQFPYLVRAAEPFSHIISDELHLCKLCKLWETAHVNEDVFSISFKMIGVNTSCTESELKELLTTELQELYVCFFGQPYPLVYPVRFDRNVVTFWIATNLHGNVLIRQRANADYYADSKEPEVLEDE